MHASPQREPSEPGLAAELALLTASRTVINTGLRFVYPFLPALARGVGTSTAVLGQVLALRSLAGMAGPIFGTLSDRYGRRPVMAGSLVLLALGCSLPLFGSGLAGLTLALLSIGLAKAIFDPALQGRVSDRVPYRSRGRALAITELSWAGALLVGAPICAWLIDRFGWQAPFLAFSLCGVGAALAIGRGMEPARRAADDGHHDDLTSGSPAVELPDDLSTAGPGSDAGPLSVLRRHSSVRALLICIVALLAGNELLLVVFGQWLEQRFELSLGGLGMAAALIALAEVFGELTVAALADRMGPRRLAGLAGLVATGSYLALPLAAGSLVTALVLLVVIFAGFEIAFVSLLPLATELVPDARAATMSLVMAATSLGRASGAAAGAWVYLRGGFPGTSTSSALLTIIALTVLWRSVADPQVESQDLRPLH